MPKVLLLQLKLGKKKRFIYDLLVSLSKVKNTQG